MNRIEIKDFSIKIDKDKVLKTLGCFEGSSVYETVSSYFDELEETVMDLLSPRAVAVTEDMKAYCILTVGEKISGISKSFFDNGEGMKGILVDAMADEYLFMMDDVLAENIKLLCAKKSWGVKKRLDAPKDFPLSQQSVIVAKTGVDGIKMTSGFMFEPVKTFGYILEFTTDEKVFNAQHDCSKCSNFDCPRRSNIKNGRFEVLSSYEYKPNFKDGDSAVCIDIGTTTVAFELVTDKGTLKTYRTINPQRRFGLDVLSRIESANRGRLDELSAVMRYTIISGYKKVTEEFGDTKKVVIAGNTTMVHLLMGYSCGTLGEYPFKSKHLGTLKTIADKPPVGLCGTGIIELVSELLDEKIIDKTGLLNDDYFINGYKVAEDVVFTQNDIRQVQMAKSAVRAGIDVLAKSWGTELSQIDTVYLAGGFGYGLSIEKACNIGILPREFLGKTKVIGNSSLGGCVKYAERQDGDERIGRIKEISSEISLGNSEDFEKLYIEYMNF